MTDQITPAQGAHPHDSERSLPRRHGVEAHTSPVTDQVVPPPRTGKKLITGLAISALVLGGGFLAHRSFYHSSEGFSAPGSFGSSAEVVSINDLPQSVLLTDSEQGRAPVALISRSEWEGKSATTITFNGTEVTSNSPQITTANNVTTIRAAGIYRLTGNSSGQIVVDAPDDALVVIILDELHIDTHSGPAIDIRAAKNAVVVVEGDNSIADASSYTDSASANAALYADTDLQLSGSGKLTINGRGNDGIAATDSLVIDGPTISVQAADDGLRGKDALAILSGTLDIAAGGDALKSDQETDNTKGNIFITGGTTHITADDDAVHAESLVSITGGNLSVDSAYEGLEAAVVDINGGHITLNTHDDAINGASDTQDALVQIRGGEVTIHAEGDALDANGTLNITGGTVTAWGPSNDGNGTIDADAAFTVTGGRLIAAASAGMAMVPTSDGIGWVSATVSARQGAQVTITQAGTLVASFSANKSFENLLFADSALMAGQEVTVTIDGVSTNVTANEGRNTGPGGGMDVPGAPRPRH